MIRVIGILAVLLTTTQFIPQVYRAYHLKSIHGLSLSTFLMITATATTWVIYGVLIADRVVVIANFFVLVSTAAIVLRMLYLRRRS